MVLALVREHVEAERQDVVLERYAQAVWWVSHTLKHQAETRCPSPGEGAAWLLPTLLAVVVQLMSTRRRSILGSARSGLMRAVVRGGSPPFRLAQFLRVVLDAHVR